MKMLTNRVRAVLRAVQACLSGLSGALSAEPAPQLRPIRVTVRPRR